MSAVARARWPEARHIVGEGRWAAVRHCNGTSVVLSASEADAQRALAHHSTSPYGPDPACGFRHEVVDLDG